MSKFVKIGHRGAAGHYPENTIGSFVKAIKLGADAIEFDVRLSGDGKIVVFHDPTLYRTTNHWGHPRDFAYEELWRLDAGKGEKIPTLEQVFMVLGKGNPWSWKPFFNIELKESGTRKEILPLIERYHLIDSVIISAFDMNENKPGDTSAWSDLFALKRSEPDLRIALIVGHEENFWRAIVLAMRQGNVYAINPSRGIITREMITAAHAWGIKVFVWTVNEPSEIARIKTMGVDGIFSDYPDRL